MLKNIHWVLIFSALTSFSYAQNKAIRKAENCIYIGDYAKSESLYLSALKKQPDNFSANRGLGVLYVEYMEKEEFALPYLQKAIELANRNKKPIDGELQFAYAKTLHYLNRYEDALVEYLNMKNYECIDDFAFQPELNKRIADCEFAINYIKSNKEKPLVYVVNMGDKVNTTMPEYVPVLINDEKLIFTSKRKDSKKEKLNPANCEYYESMYISDMKSGYPSSPARYTIPQTQLKFKNVNENEAVVSAISGDKIYIYNNKKLLEGTISSTSEKPIIMSSAINFDIYQNHASISKDGTKLYFTSESSKGMGGIDIFVSTKNNDGSWGTPENIGQEINTAFDEEAPYISDDGNTLYFSSKGHNGFGGFDIFKSSYENGKWSKPVNMGLPFNSPANDVFFIQNNNNMNGYFASSRAGGKGSLDLYKINFLNKIPDCTSAIAQTLDTKINSKEKNTYTIFPQIAEIYKNKVLEYSCTIDDSIVTDSYQEITHTFLKSGNHTIKTKLVAYCDTCLNMYVACNEQTIEITSEITAPADEFAGMGFNLKPLYFNFNESTLRKDALDIAATNIDALKKNPNCSVVIYAYTDSRGSSAYNKNLSVKRANEVKKHLIANGISTKRISIIGKGEEDLANTCSDGTECSEEQHQQNRRAEFKIIKN